MDFLPAAGFGGLPASMVCSDVELRHALSVLDPYPRDRQVGTARVGSEHAVAPSRAPRRNPKYLDKNYAGTLIIWDRMFGTFQAEEEEPVYGLTKPLNSWNPLWANLHIWSELCRDAWLAPRWIDKLRIWFMPQGWRPEGLPANPAAPEVTRETVVLYDRPVPRGLNVYALVQFVSALLLAVGLLVTRRYALLHAQLVVAALLVLWTLLNIGGIFDHRPWALVSELVRLPVVAALVVANVPDHQATVSVGLPLVVLAMWLFLLGCRRHFLAAQDTPERRNRSCDVAGVSGSCPRKMMQAPPPTKTWRRCACTSHRVKIERKIRHR